MPSSRPDLGPHLVEKPSRTICVVFAEPTAYFRHAPSPKWSNALQGDDKTAHKAAFESMRTTICAATSTMTSVPKPLKFLRPHYDTIKEVFATIADPETKVRAAWHPSLTHTMLKKPYTVYVRRQWSARAGRIFSPTFQLPVK